MRRKNKATIIAPVRILTLNSVDLIDRTSEWKELKELCMGASFHEEIAEHIKAAEIYGRYQRGNASKLLSGIKHIAVNTLHQENRLKAGLKTSRRKAAMDKGHLAKLLQISGLRNLDI